MQSHANRVHLYSFLGPNVPPSLVSPNLSTTSCTSDPFPPEDLPVDLDADFLFEASGTWDSRGLYLVFCFPLRCCSLVGTGVAPKKNVFLPRYSFGSPRMAIEIVHQLCCVSIGFIKASCFIFGLVYKQAALAFIMIQALALNHA